MWFTFCVNRSHSEHIARAALTPAIVQSAELPTTRHLVTEIQRVVKRRPVAAQQSVLGLASCRFPTHHQSGTKLWKKTPALHSLRQQRLSFRCGT